MKFYSFGNHVYGLFAEYALKLIRHTFFSLQLLFCLHRINNIYRFFTHASLSVSMDLILNIYFASH